MDEDAEDAGGSSDDDGFESAGEEDEEEDAAAVAELMLSAGAEKAVEAQFWKQVGSGTDAAKGSDAEYRTQVR